MVSPGLAPVVLVVFQGGPVKAVSVVTPLSADSQASQLLAVNQDTAPIPVTVVPGYPAFLDSAGNQDIAVTLDSVVSLDCPDILGFRRFPGRVDIPATADTQD